MELETRPWGTFEILLDSPECKVKRIIVYPDQRLSLQSHEHRSETWTVVQGMAGITIDNSDNVLMNKSTTYIPQGAKHRIRNICSPQHEENLIFIEVQHSTKGIFDETDITRYEDDYNRK